MNNIILSIKERRLLDELGKNARMPISELAKKLGVSRTTAQQRLNRLEQKGVISGYAIRLGAGYQSSLIRAHTNLTIEPNAQTRIVGALEKISAIDTLFSVSGKFDLIAILSTESASQLDGALDRIGEISGILSTETAIVLTTRFSRHDSPAD